MKEKQGVGTADVGGAGGVKGAKVGGAVVVEVSIGVGQYADEDGFMSDGWPVWGGMLNVVDWTRVLVLNPFAAGTLPSLPFIESKPNGDVCKVLVAVEDA